MHTIQLKSFNFMVYSSDKLKSLDNDKHYVLDKYVYTTQFPLKKIY